MHDRELNQEEAQAIAALVCSYRDWCLPFLRPDFLPSSLSEALRVLDAIERHGDLTAFRETRRLRAWLLPSPKEPTDLS